VLLLLIRHGLTDLTATRLVGRTPGVPLNDVGRRQAESVAERLAGLPIEAVYSSPMERARETAAPLAAARGLEVEVDQRLNEMDYGEWAGQPYRELSRTDLWKRVQARPLDARFPGGEAVREAQARMVAAIEAMFQRHPAATVAAFSHADPIKLAVAHLVGLHGDLMQRLVIDLGSVTALRVGDGPPALVRLNDAGGLDRLVPPTGRGRGRAGRGGAAPPPQR
jgi:probable phosphoglycerate mutase